VAGARIDTAAIVTQAEEALTVDGEIEVLLVKLMLPWVNCCATAERRTPLPMAVDVVPRLAAA